MKENNEERLKEWIEKADHDLGTAIIIFQYINEYSDTFAFHCQQAVEKYIKCLLEKHSISYKKSHDLRYLLALLDDFIQIDNTLYEKILMLNAFGVEVRDPDFKIEMTGEERIEAINTVKDVRSLLKKHIGFEIEDSF